MYDGLVRTEAAADCPIRRQQSVQIVQSQGTSSEDTLEFWRTHGFVVSDDDVSVCPVNELQVAVSPPSRRTSPRPSSPPHLKTRMTRRSTLTWTPWRLRPTLNRCRSPCTTWTWKVRGQRSDSLGSQHLFLTLFFVFQTTYSVSVSRPTVADRSVPDLDLTPGLDLCQGWTWRRRTLWTIRASGGAVSPQENPPRRAGSTWASWSHSSECCHTEVRLTCEVVCGPSPMLNTWVTLSPSPSQDTMETVWMTSSCFPPVTCRRTVCRTTSMWWITCSGTTPVFLHLWGLSVANFLLSVRGGLLQTLSKRSEPVCSSSWTSCLTPNSFN